MSFEQNPLKEKMKSTYGVPLFCLLLVVVVTAAALKETGLCRVITDPNVCAKTFGCGWCAATPTSPKGICYNPGEHQCCTLAGSFCFTPFMCMNSTSKCCLPWTGCSTGGSPVCCPLGTSCCSSSNSANCCRDSETCGDDGQCH